MITIVIIGQQWFFKPEYIIFFHLVCNFNSSPFISCRESRSTPAKGSSSNNTSGSFKIPAKAFQNEYIINPTADMTYTGSWHRYTYAVSQSYWRPVEGQGLLNQTVQYGNVFKKI